MLGSPLWNRVGPWPGILRAVTETALSFISTIDQQDAWLVEAFRRADLMVRELQRSLALL